MSIRLLLILTLFLVSINAEDKNSTAPKSNGLETKKGDKEEKKDDSKMKVAGLYETNKVANVKSLKGNRPVSKVNRLLSCFLTFFISCSDNETGFAHAKRLLK